MNVTHGTTRQMVCHIEMNVTKLYAVTFVLTWHATPCHIKTNVTRHTCHIRLWRTINVTFALMFGAVMLKRAWHKWLVTFKRTWQHKASSRSFQHDSAEHSNEHDIYGTSQSNVTWMACHIRFNVTCVACHVKTNVTAYSFVTFISMWHTICRVVPCVTFIWSWLF